MFRVIYFHEHNRRDFSCNGDLMKCCIDSRLQFFKYYKNMRREVIIQVFYTMDTQNI